MAEEKNTISVPAPLYDKIREKIKDTEFKSVSDYVIYVLNELMSEEDEEALSKEDEEKIKARLRSLGYID